MAEEPFQMQVPRRDGKRGWDYPHPRFTWTPTIAHEHQAARNHGQTLKRLNERGGVCWSELYAILFGRKWGDINDEVWAKAQCLKAFPEALSDDPARR